MRFLGFSLILFVYQFSWGQAVIHKETKEALEPKEVFYVVGNIENKKKIKISNLTVHRTNDIFGKNEFLEIIFDVYNYTAKPQDLRISVVGFELSNFSKSEYRKHIPFPIWRKRDFDAEKTYIIYLDSVPKIPIKDIYKFIKQNDLIKFSEEFRFTPDLNNIKDDEYPNPIDYLQYLQSMTSKIGIPFTLSAKSENSSYSESDSVFIVNRCRFIRNSLETSVNCKIQSEETLNIKERKFFTHFILVVYNTTSLEVVYRKTFKFTHKPFLN